MPGSAARLIAVVGLLVGCAAAARAVPAAAVE